MRQHRLKMLAIVLAACASAVTSFSLTQDEPDRDFTFARGLIKEGFPDLADKVVLRVLRFHPGEESRAKLLQTEIAIARGKLTDAEAIMESMNATDPKAQAARLALANAHYARHNNARAQEIYTAFFQQYAGNIPEDEELRSFYRNAAHRFSQMQERKGNLAGAVAGYENAIKATDDKDLLRQLRVEASVLYTRLAEEQKGDARTKALKRADELCQQVLWGPQDLWFGKAINCLAGIRIAEGRPEEADKLIVNNMDILRRIHEVLTEENIDLNISPLAGARFQLGRIHEARGDKLNQGEEALAAYAAAAKEYANVFIRYNESDWGGEAGKRYEQVKTILEERFGRPVTLDLGPYRDQLAEAQFRRADELYVEGDYARALEIYLNVINRYPEAARSAEVLGRMGFCWAQVDDHLHVAMLLRYMAERFAGQEGAALGLLRIGKFYFDRKDEERYKQAYGMYVEHFPQDARVPGVLYSMALADRQNGNDQGMQAYLRLLVDTYQDNQFYLKGLSLLAFSLYQQQDYEQAAATFQRFIEVSQPGADMVRAQFSLADALYRTGKPLEAVEAYRKLVQWVGKGGAAYAATQEEADTNRDLQQKATFFQALCYFEAGRRNEQEAEKHNEAALKQIDAFLAAYPDTELGPNAYDLKGRIELSRGLYDDAAKTYELLAQKYPTSEQGKSALFQLARSAIEIGKLDVGKDAITKMMSSGGKFTPEQFVQAAQWMLDAQAYQEAAAIFQHVLSSGTEERAVVERALYGQGEALFGMGDYAGTVKAMESLLKAYPNSALFYPAQFTMARAAKENNDLTTARAALREVFRFAKDANLRTKADVELARLQKQAGETGPALASFTRVVMLADPTEKELRPYIRISILESLEMFEQQGRWQDVARTCESYLTIFPQGEELADIRRRKASAELKIAAGAAPGT